jgi:hypothetical protein
MKTLKGGLAMDRNELLIKLCRELTEKVEELYRECKRAVSGVSWVAQRVNRELEEELLWAMDRVYRALEKNRVKELSWGIRRIVEEGMQDKEEGEEKMKGEKEDRKALLLKLCEELTKAVEYFYHEEDAGLKAHLGEVLGRYGSLLSDISWAITWEGEEVQNKMFEILEDAFRRQEQHRLKCRLEEWLSWKVKEIVDEALEDKEEGRENQQEFPSV